MKYTKEILEPIIKRCYTMRQVLKELGLKQNSGGSSSNIRKRIKQFNIDTSHFTGKHHMKGKTHTWNKAIPLEEILVENSTYNRSHLKKRLLKNGMLKNECSICGQNEIWNEIKLIMVLDHINGINDDNRLKNLRMLCPNCNSQQVTFCRGTIQKETKCCSQCNIEITKGSSSQLCKSCSHKGMPKKRKVENRPDKEQLLKEVEELGYCGTGRKYSVSDNTIRKWLK